MGVRALAGLATADCKAARRKIACVTVEEERCRGLRNGELQRCAGHEMTDETGRRRENARDRAAWAEFRRRRGFKEAAKTSLAGNLTKDMARPALRAADDRHHAMLRTISTHLKFQIGLITALDDHLSAGAIEYQLVFDVGDPLGLQLDRCMGSTGQNPLSRNMCLRATSICIRIDDLPMKIVDLNLVIIDQHEVLRASPNQGDNNRRSKPAAAEHDEAC